MIGPELCLEPVRGPPKGHAITPALLMRHRVSCGRPHRTRRRRGCLPCCPGRPPPPRGRPRAPWPPSRPLPLRPARGSGPPMSPRHHGRPRPGRSPGPTHWRHRDEEPATGEVHPFQYFVCGGAPAKPVRHTAPPVTSTTARLRRRPSARRLRRVSSSVHPAPRCSLSTRNLVRGGVTAEGRDHVFAEGGQRLGWGEVAERRVDTLIPAGSSCPGPPRITWPPAVHISVWSR